MLGGGSYAVGLGFGLGLGFGSRFELEVVLGFEAVGLFVTGASVLLDQQGWRWGQCSVRGQTYGYDWSIGCGYGLG